MHRLPKKLSAVVAPLLMTILLLSGANIALAAADLATKTVAVAKQMATASSAVFYGFNASLDLDIDMLEKQFAAYQEQSVASNLNADKINISTGASMDRSNINFR